MIVTSNILVNLVYIVIFIIQNLHKESILYFVKFIRTLLYNIVYSELTGHIIIIIIQ